MTGHPRPPRDAADCVAGHGCSGRLTGRLRDTWHTGAPVAGVALLPWYATERALSFRSSSACRCWSTWIPGSGRRGGFNPSRRSEPSPGRERHGRLASC